MPSSPIRPRRAGFPQLAALLLLSLSALSLGACKPGAEGSPAPATEARNTPVTATADRDEHSYAQPDKVVTEDLALDLALDFDARTIAGTATYTLQWKDDTATELVLDTRDLAIDKVEGEADGQWQPLQFALAPADPTLGSKLTIETPQRNTRVRVTYTTSPDASGLQWLTPEMTEGGQLPFMFSQSQQIHARSWVPLQDTPAIRYTYTAHVTSRPDVMVLMSADNDPDAARDGDYTFSMPQPIPSYLMAIAAGDLVFKPISGRAGVWAEPATIDRAVAEFEDTEKMIETTEALYGPYRWERYDLLILPPSFPYGGMENPRLSFITPTVIVGDKSLVSLIAHELAHSWSGNLVTFSSAKHGWLNEGFTSYVENRIVESLYGKEFSDMEYVIARNALADGIAAMPEATQALAVRPGTELDADDALSAVSYDKGAWFLQFLEQRFGREVFDAFLRDYFDHFAFQSITTEQFLDYARANLFDKHPDTVTDAEIQEWVYGPGIPAYAPQVLSRNFGIVDSARLAWLGSPQLPPRQITDAWSTQEWLHFLDSLPPTLTHAQMAQLDAAYGFTGTDNGEIAMRWYPLAVRSGYTEANDALAAFTERVGRRKLIMPIYTALVQTEPGLALAKEIFARARPGYHPITTASVEKLIAEAKPAPAPAPAADATTETSEAPSP
ncbi:M1 family metallopeptidase [Luteimonas sp. BDR2-5]|uniref:M1 family metallopeptidase n=1 Tax=Proluteimonas luteida TaxID=2878685 RepID=UPI001E2D711F|nr:M1 family metallopeptidase [Luteimonas sp. BDR2-5]MCD9027200.1 M1 family metallopeptidase [Luteimonas sp. BDR2-5]